MHAADDKPVDFAHDVLPILKQHCVECHGGAKAEGGFSLNTRELLLESYAAVPGKPEESTLVERITADDADARMPPADKPPLSAEQIDLLTRWIAQGAAWQEGFTFAPARYEPPLHPRKPELPPVVDGRTNPIDRILDNYLAEREIARPAPIDDAAYLRRVSLDLVGLLPTTAELEAFLADPSSDKRAIAARRLLGQKRAYADHWLTFWNDLLRNDYAGTGYIDGGRTQITGWLYASLVENKPYDQFVRELIAPTEHSSGFIAGIKWRGNVNASQTREVQFAQSISQVLLGINMKCASCHDSFIDRWTLAEAYSLAAIYATEPIEIHRCDKPTGQMAQAAWIFPELGSIDAAAPQPQRLEQLAGLMTHQQNGRFTRTVVNRLWQRLMGRGIVHPVDAMHTEPFSADLLDYLAVYLAEHNCDLKAVLELIVTSQAYQSASEISDEEAGGVSYVYRGPIARRLTAEQFIDAIWQLTGTGPAKADAKVKRPKEVVEGRPAVRAGLMKSNLLMRALDRPNREQVVTTRPTTLTTLQAIDLANGQILADMLKAGAAQILARPEAKDSAQLVQWLYTAALSRQPTSAEREVMLDVVGTQPTAAGVEDALWTMLMLPEFQLVR